MRKPYSSALVQHFTANETFFWGGNCSIRKGKGRTICEIWQRVDETTIRGFVRVRSHPQAEAFGIDIGWNNEPVICEPAFADPKYFDFHGEALKFLSNTVSLQLLATGNDQLWNIIEVDDAIRDPTLLIKPLSNEEALRETTESFQKAMKLILEVGLPYLAQASGISR
jgi:hypothetical protein